MQMMSDDNETSLVQDQLDSEVDQTFQSFVDDIDVEDFLLQLQTQSNEELNQDLQSLVDTVDGESLLQLQTQLDEVRSHLNPRAKKKKTSKKDKIRKDTDKKKLNTLRAMR